MATVERAGSRVYGELKEGLLGGRYGPGERLNVEALASELGVSRQPIFDAFKRLSTEGLVSVKAHVGCHVAVYGMDEIGDYFQIFAAVEGKAAAMAAERRTDRQIQRLRRLHAMIGGLVTLVAPDERSQGYRALNREFHSLIHAMCGTPIVERFCAGMYDRADFFINTSANALPFAHSIVERHADHARIVAGIEASDPVAAGDAASDHILGTVALIGRAVERFGRRATS